MVRANPLEELVAGMTVAELAEKSGRSVGDIVGWAMANGRSSAARTGSSSPASAAVPSTRRVSKSKDVDTRTAAGRAAYEEAVLEIVRNAKDSVAATDIREKLGGTPQQVRAALNRLIETGVVRYRGKARATRYFPA